MKKPPGPNAAYEDGSLLGYYRAVNEARRECLVYHLGRRGFCAELTSVALAMAYAWHHDLQLVLDSSEFAYRFRDGWSDYFQPFCSDVSEVPADRIRERFRFEDRRHFQNLRAFAPETFGFGVLRFDDLQPRIGNFTRLMFQLGYESECAVRRLRERLRLPRDYIAIHVRRGDKVGDEDVSYPVERYFAKLEQLGGLGRSTVFVLSDDSATVEEVRGHLRSTGHQNRVVSLCLPEHAGFSVKKLQAGKDFAGSGRTFDTDQEYREYAREETHRLLAEISIAARATRFVTTLHSNVGRTIWYLHRDREQCGQLS